VQEAVRNGDVKTIETLLDHGADMNGRTKAMERGASGGSPLYWALYYHGEDHKMVDMLKGRGAKHFGPGDKQEL
jgi:hypothetical protein